MEQSFESSIFPDKPLIYGSFWARVAAAILDSLVTGIPMSIIDRVIFPNAIMTPFFMGAIAGWIYSALLESGPGMATLGKMAVGIKVTDLSGNRISFAKASGRFFGKYLSAAILGIGFLMMLWTERRQTLHDIMAGTLVVSSK